MIYQATILVNKQHIQLLPFCFGLTNCKIHYLYLLFNDRFIGIYWLSDSIFINYIGCGRSLWFLYGLESMICLALKNEWIVYVTKIGPF